MNTENISIGFEPGNRTSVMHVLRSAGNVREKSVRTLSTYGLYDPNQLFQTKPSAGSVYHNDRLYLVGDDIDGQHGAKSFTSLDKYQDTDGLLILMKSLLCQVLPKSKNRSYAASVGIGVPIGWMSGQVKEIITNTLLGKHHLQSVKGEHSYVDIKTVAVYHEPIGAYAALRSDNGNNEVRYNCNILDIGYDTTDTFTYSNGAMVNDLTITMDIGMYNLFRSLQNDYQQKNHSVTRPVRYWEQFIKSYQPGQNETHDSIINAFIHNLIDTVRENWNGIANKPNLALVGGGGSFLQPVFNSHDIPTLKVNDPQTINARGLALLANKESN